MNDHQDYALSGTCRVTRAMVPAFLLLLSACSGTTRFIPSIFHPTEPAAEASKAEEQTAPLVYYVGSADLELYREPGRNLITHLPLHQKVLRYRLVRGYAYVTVDGTGQEGWLDNSKLMWRLPEQPSAVQRPSLPPAADRENTTVPEAAAPAPPDEAPDATTRAAPEEEPQKQPAEQAPAGTSEPVSPSVFEPF